MKNAISFINKTVDWLFTTIAKLTKAILCDKDENGKMTTTPSFAKLWFLVIMATLLKKPDSMSEWWWLVCATILAYILFGSKFIPAFFQRSSSSYTSGEEEF